MTTIRTTWLAVLLMFATMLSAADRPNVLFIAADDLNMSLGCYGNEVVRTPHLDSLAARGLRFDRAYCQYPVCNPSRSSLLGGRRPVQGDIIGNSIDWTQRLPLGSTLPEQFIAAGYETVRVGKLFHAGNSGRVYDDSPRWSRVLDENEGLGPRAAARPMRDLFADAGEQEKRDNYTKRAWLWGPSGRNDIDEGDARIAEQAVRELLKPHDKPLFLAVGFHKPHLPLSAPDKYFDLYDVESIPLPVNPPDDLQDSVQGRNLLVHEAMDDRARREAIAAYYATVSLIDAQVGRIIAALEKSGQADNTIIFFWSDHGFHLGQHYLWQKSTVFEESARVPLLVVAPGVTKAGSVSPRLVELIDMYPTLCELAGIKTPDWVEGTSFVPLLRDPDRPWKKAAFTLTGGNLSLRTERYRYIESRRGVALYDHQRDPGEFHNVADDPKYAAALAELKALMEAGWKAALPR